MSQQFVTQFSALREKYPGMRLGPARKGYTLIRGALAFKAKTANGPEISESYDIEIQLPDDFPSRPPAVFETSQRIPRDGNHHVHSDGSLCLGSPLTIRHLLFTKYNTLLSFTDGCIVPFLYAITLEKEKRGYFIFGELSHGQVGLNEEYFKLFGVSDQSEVLAMLELLGTKKRLANKMLCPCKCGNRLGKCSTNRKLTPFRLLAPRSWYKKHREEYGQQIR